MKKMSGAQALIAALLREGVETAFGYPGGAIMPIYDALYDVRESLRHVLVRHEQGAAHAAEGYARMKGKPGVAMATSGPGATNLVTGIADAMLDSVPMVCITGQVNSWALGTDAFQETDVIGITIPITKWNYQITKPEEIPAIVAKAFAIASNGRPGPVLIDITKDAQTKTFEWTPEIDQAVEDARQRVRVTLASPVIDTSNVGRAAELLNEAKRPFMLVGHGALIAEAQDEVRILAEKAGIPVGLTLHGLSAFPTGHELCAGMLGMHGNYGPNVLTNKADVILAVGMRFDDRVTGDPNGYASTAKIIHIEVDPAEIGKVVKTEVGIVADAKRALQDLIPLVKENTHPEWLSQFHACREQEEEKVIRDAISPQDGSIRMSEVVHQLATITNGGAVIVADVGQHQMMAARYYGFSEPNSWVTSGGLGTMGFALPAAIGAKFGAPERQVIAIIGDGGFQMNSQELMTICQEKLNVKTVILNNNFLGMVRQWQELFFENRYSSVDMQNPDFVKLAEANGIEAARVTERGALKDAIEQMLSSEGAFLLEVVVENEQNVFPMVPSGASVSDIRLE